MAMTQDQIRALDQLRQRLSQLNASIAALKLDLERNEPLPTWSHLQSAAAALSFNLQQLTSTFQTHAKFLKEAHAYPLPTYPGLSQEGLLEQLLRKKLEPGAEDWIESYTSKFEAQAAGSGGEGGLGRQELKELWNSAARDSSEIVGPMLEDGLFEDDFTIAEREAGVEKVATGLKRKLEGQDEKGEDDEDKMEDVMPSAPAAAASEEEAGIDATSPTLPIDGLLRLTSTGAAPTTSVLPKRESNANACDKRASGCVVQSDVDLSISIPHSRTPPTSSPKQQLSTNNIVLYQLVHLNHATHTTHKTRIMESLEQTLRSILKPLTHNLPTPIRTTATQLLGDSCYRSLVHNLNFRDVDCLKLALSKVLGVGIVSASAVVKVPQLLKILNSQSAEGVSFLSYLLETASYLITLLYNVRRQFPFSTYGEVAFIVVQNVAISVLVLQYSGRAPAAAVFVAGLAGAGYAMYSDVICPMSTMQYLQAGAGMLGVASKVPQIVTIWQEGGTGQLSAFAVFTYLVGSLARIFTTLQEVPDKLILYGFIAAFALNAVIAAQMTYYWDSPKSKQTSEIKLEEKGKEAAKQATTTGVQTRSKNSPSTRRRG